MKNVETAKALDDCGNGRRESIHSSLRNRISRSFPNWPLFAYFSFSFEDVILLIPVTGSKRKSIKGDTKVSIVECVNERIYGTERKANE